MRIFKLVKLCVIVSGTDSVLVTLEFLNCSENSHKGL